MKFQASNIIIAPEEITTKNFVIFERYAFCKYLGNTWGITKDRVRNDILIDLMRGRTIGFVETHETDIISHIKFVINHVSTGDVFYCNTIITQHAKGIILEDIKNNKNCLYKKIKPAYTELKKFTMDILKEVTKLKGD